MRNREYVPSFSERLAQGSEARAANIAHAREALGQGAITESAIRSRRAFHLPRIVALPLASLLVVAAGSGCGYRITNEPASTPTMTTAEKNLNAAKADLAETEARLAALKASLTPTPTIHQSATEVLARATAVRQTETATPKAIVARGESTVTPTATGVSGSAERTNKEVASKMELPRPAAWDHVPSVSLVQASSVPSFPKTATEAAATFGVDGSTKDPKRWELTPEGGWHLSEAQIGDDTKDALNVNPKGYLMEGYYDTKPGRNPYALVAVGINSNIPIQGATFWNEQRVNQADKLQNEMAIPKWRDENGNVTIHPVTKIVPNQEQKVTVAPAEYPETAEKAASLFGGKPEQWKLNPQGVWNFNSNEETAMTLDRVTADGYNKDGLVVATGSNGKVSVKLLGGTFYNLKPTEVQALIDAVKANNPGKQIQVVGVE